jgi:thiosulfate dehydrogenase
MRVGVYLKGLSAAVLIVLAATISAIAQQPKADAPFDPPDEATIPSGPLGEAIRLGKLLTTETGARLPDYVGNALRCTSCHLDAGRTQNAAPWVGIWGVFPEYRSRSASVNLLEDRINDCFERSLNGKRLPVDSAEMRAMQSYMRWLSQGVPTGVNVQGRGFKRIVAPASVDPVRGKEVFAAKCLACHGPDGQGTFGAGGEMLYPPLWGPRSFSIGAGMGRLSTAAAFVKANMPFGQGGTLTDQEAYDVAAYFTQQPRPDFARKQQDWPKGDKPQDARY